MTAQDIPNDRNPEPRRRLSEFLIGIIVLGALTLSIVAGIALLRQSKPRIHRIPMITDITPLRIFLAEKLRAEGVRHNLEIAPTAKHSGALESLAEVDGSSQALLALAPGGITAREYPNVATVATLTQEPLHILVRKGLSGQGLLGLRGKRVNLGPTTTASHHLSREVLAFVELVPSIKPNDGGYVMETVAPDKLYQELGRIAELQGPARLQAEQSLPDAAVFLEPMPSQLAKRLVTAFEYTLVPIPFAEAFCLDRLNPPNDAGVRVDRSMLNPITIPIYTYGSNPPEPATACMSISAPLLLITQANTDPEAVFRLLETIFDSPLTNSIRPMPLREHVYAFPPHSGTDRFQRRFEPLLTADTIAELGTLGGGIGAFISGLVAFYTLVRLRKLHRFELYYREIGRIEMIALGTDYDPDAPVAPDALRTYLEVRLSRLKCRVLEDFADGGLKGEGLLTGIIALINDTRESLTRMPTLAHSEPPDPAHSG